MPSNDSERVEHTPHVRSPSAILRRIVVFWVGADTTLPTLLVRSVRRAMGDSIEIIQLSDSTTPEIAAVARCDRRRLSKHMMVARLEAYAGLAVAEPTLYLDADMLVLRAFDLPPIAENEVGLTSRSRDMLINWKYPMPFPEFEGRYIMEVMPYIYSFVYTRSHVLFERQLARLTRMPQRFQEWYGDQVTLKAELDSGKRFVPRMFSGEIYNRTIACREDLMTAVRGGVCIAHFKGPGPKQAMPAAFAWLARQPLAIH